MGHLGCAHLLTIVNRAALNTGMQVSQSQFSILSGMGIELLGHLVISVLGFWGPAKLFPTAAAPFYIHTSMSEASNFCTSSPTLVVFKFLLFFFSFRAILVDGKSYPTVVHLPIFSSAPPCSPSSHLSRWFIYSSILSIISLYSSIYVVEPYENGIQLSWPIKTAISCGFI